ncbi:hypothetical protein ACEPAI_4072 [Sanghuangporus weigelae]
MAVPSIPPELWSHIFQFLSTVDEVTDSSSDAWANIVTANAKYTHAPSRTVVECNEAKCAVGLVCKDFYELSRPVALETIRLTDTSLRYLAGQIKERPEIARVVERSTKRIDLRFTNNVFYLEPGQIVRDLEIGLELIIKSSRSLTCLLLPVRHWFWTGRFILDVVSKTCALLEVLYCPQTTRCIESPSALSSFTNLRVLDLTETLNREALKPCEFPHLHTLIGSLDIICCHFAEIRLPSLRTLVSIRSPRMSFDVTPFFQCHGKNIESFDLRGQTGLFERRTLELLPNVKEVIMDVRDEKAIGTMWSNVQKLGIIDRASDQAASLVLHNLDSIDSQREKGNYPNLKTIRILDRAFTRLLRERNSMATRLRERRLRSWSIRLEDGHGDLLLPPS